MDSQKYVTSTLLIAGEPVRFVSNKQHDPVTAARTLAATAEAIRNQLRRLDHATPRHAWLWSDSLEEKSGQKLIRLTPFTSETPNLEASAVGSLLKVATQMDSSEPPSDGLTSFGEMQGRFRPIGLNTFRCHVEPIEINLPGHKQLVGIPGLGLVNLTSLFAGDFYIVAPMRELGLRPEPSSETARKLEDYARMILQAASLSFIFTHPDTREESPPHAVIFVEESDNSLTQTVVYAGCPPDRSPGLIPSAITAALYQPRSTWVIVKGITGEQVVLNQIINQSETDNPSISYNLRVEVELIEEGVLSPIEI